MIKINEKHNLLLYSEFMITNIRSGKYKLFETFDHTKILELDNKKYAWINAENIGEILVASHKEFNPSQIIAVGNYRVYDVEKEKDLVDLQHLELFVGDGLWQGYLLPTGLPNGKIRKRIVPTKELITKTTH